MTKYPTVKEAAIACAEKHKDSAAAIGALVDIVKADHALLLEITESYLRQLCGAILNSLRRVERSKIQRATAAETALNQVKRSSERLANSTSTLLDWVLMCGTRIADADHRKLNLSAKHYKKQASTMKGHGDWLALVANNLPRGKTVGQVFKHTELKHMWDKTHA